MERILTPAEVTFIVENNDGELTRLNTVTGFNIEFQEDENLKLGLDVLYTTNEETNDQLAVNNLNEEDLLRLYVVLGDFVYVVGGWVETKNLGLSASVPDSLVTASIEVTGEYEVIPKRHLENITSYLFNADKEEIQKLQEVHELIINNFNERNNTAHTSFEGLLGSINNNENTGCCGDTGCGCQDTVTTVTAYPENLITNADPGDETKYELEPKVMSFEVTKGNLSRTTDTLKELFKACDVKWISLVDDLPEVEDEEPASMLYQYFKEAHLLGLLVQMADILHGEDRESVFLYVYYR
jgi:hypothetical protein